MAIKSADQITIVDVTDAYSVMLTSEAYTFVGGISGAAIRRRADQEDGAGRAGRHAGRQLQGGQRGTRHSAISDLQ